MKLKSQLKAPICWIALMLVMSGAKCGADVEVGVDNKTLDVLKQGIEELRRQPDRGEETMLATVK
ncbi:hypothetical protein [Kamptonema formosum]|uniref:hypothetical protein n=1 Tax=Kamptonema formosum TaxID=331992 RepID=UPI0003452A13|nr:hypothetical protein [Oscillatoria sp. PCC 10802]